jgi:chromosomal replication initiation ATPase DnaA
MLERSFTAGGAARKALAGEIGRDAPDGLGGIRQLALPFAHRPRFARADFIAAPSNAAALAWLDRDGGAQWPDHRLALWGEAGCGKTHLLQVWARDHDGLLLPGTALRGLMALPGHGREMAGGIAVDDADTATDEHALLHLLNAAREQGLPILLAGRAPPSRWPVALPDLASRLRATVAVPLHRPEEALLRILLLRLLAERQLTVAQPVVEWLLLRLPRRADAMREAARLLDHAALASGTAVTRALAASVLEEMLADPQAGGEDQPETMPLL